MAIDVKLDCIGQSPDGSLVAYLKIYRDNIFIKNRTIPYNPSKIDEFKTNVGKIILELEETLKTMEESVHQVLSEVVEEKQIELKSKKEVIK